MLTELINVWSCVDCLIWFANGESNPEWSEEERDEWFARMDHLRDYHIGVGGDHESDCPNMREGVWVGETDCYCEIIEFSMNRCDICHSRLGGSRHALHIWKAN